MDDVVLRTAGPDDAEAITDVYLASFRATYDFPMAHGDDEVRRWVTDILLPTREVWVAAVRRGGVVGMMALTPDMVDQLYVAPGWTSRGIGGRLIALAKARRPDGLDLYTFQVNGGARRFYERHGFREVERGNGSGNEERQPDVRYAWRPVRLLGALLRQRYDRLGAGTGRAPVDDPDGSLGGPRRVRREANVRLAMRMKGAHGAVRPLHDPQRRTVGQDERPTDSGLLLPIPLVGQGMGRGCGRVRRCPGWLATPVPNQ